MSCGPTRPTRRPPSAPTSREEKRLDMKTPIVAELPRRLEFVTRDPFIDGLPRAACAPQPATSSRSDRSRSAGLLKGSRRWLGAPSRYRLLVVAAVLAV